MPDLSEFVEFIAEKTGIENRSLIERDVIIHRILKEISENFGRNYIFKGGSCLIKCYLGYYRFSVDLDFTWLNQEIWEGLGRKRIRKKLIEKINEFAKFLELVGKKMNIDFLSNLEDKKYFEFGGGGRMVTFKMWYKEEIIKIQVNFVEKILFKPKERRANTLLTNAKLDRNEKTYFQDFFEFYKPFNVVVYDIKEILCEKIRAILTRRKQKLRDFYDIFVVDPKLTLVSKLKQQIIDKILFSLYYQKYRENLEKNRKFFDIGNEILEDPFERSMFIVKPTKEFETFLRNFKIFTKHLLQEIK